MNDGYSLDEIRAVMGHTTSKTTERYATYQTGKLVDVMRGKKGRLFTPEFTGSGSEKLYDINKKMVGARGFEPPTYMSKL